MKTGTFLRGISRIAFICTTKPYITLKLKTTLVKAVYCITKYTTCNCFSPFHEGNTNNEVKYCVIIPLSDNCSYLNLFVYTHTRVQYFWWTSLTFNKMSVLPIFNFFLQWECCCNLSRMVQLPWWHAFPETQTKTKLV